MTLPTELYQHLLENSAFRSLGVYLVIYEVE